MYTALKIFWLYVEKPEVVSHRIPLLDIYLKDCTCVPTDISKTVSRRIISNRKNMEHQDIL